MITRRTLIDGFTWAGNASRNELHIANALTPRRSLCVTSWPLQPQLAPHPNNHLCVNCQDLANRMQLFPDYQISVSIEEA